VFLRDTSVVSSMALLLFGGALTVLHEEGAILVGGWLRLLAAAGTAVLVKELRGALDALLAAKVAGGRGRGAGGQGGRGAAAPPVAALEAKVVGAIERMLGEAEVEADRRLGLRL
jgi:hypothetical protein